MPTIDVDDVLIDPDISDQAFTVIRREEIVNQYGESTVNATRIGAVGSVQPQGDQSLLREEGQDAQAKSITVYTAYRLRGVSKGPNATRYKPDIILWNNDYFEVISLEDYSPFGRGFIQAECTAIHYVDNPPRNAFNEIGRLDFSQVGNSGLINLARGV